ncbi:uncharacterized protein BX664DRAFT_342211 [Halteromyces radiatus]|uniref:uncharacterized protein n=1 Tax=Halteromyces radiatus TaxID=101107 RepID=UPI00221F91A5|nr:uncharacterized protein BX664DRAFT_342211 [Halteromyces radiatus]KAI8080059.1 hypothetical protein BX664DRAFT_342211 [Halteromyces radiatus]
MTDRGNTYQRQRRRSQGLREILALFHVSIMVLGLIMACSGAYLLAGNVSLSTSMGLLSIGGIVGLMSFLAGFGSHQEHAGFLKVYCGFTALALFCQLMSLGWLYIQSQDHMLDAKIKIIWDFFYTHDEWFLLDIEQLFHCCGYASPQDRPVPLTCQISTIGCKSAWLQFGTTWHHGLLVGLFIFLILQMGSLLITLITLMMVEKEAREDELHESLLQNSCIGSRLYHHHLLGEGDSRLRQYNAWSSHYYPQRTIGNKRNQSPPHYGALI